MKKVILLSIAAVAMLLTASCQKDNLKGYEAGETAEVGFTIDLPVELTTKAIGDGSTATELYYSVFSQNGEYLQSLAQAAPVAVEGNTASLKLKLVRNYTYTLVFWAQAPDAPYTFDAETGVVTVDYAGDANDEARDAFCQVHTFKVPDQASYDETVYLYRPFAQINFGAADLAPITELGLAMESTVAISGLADTYDMLNGTVSGNATTALDLNTVPAQFTPAETLFVQGQEYGYVSMNYVLAPVNAYKELANVTATFAYNGETVEVDVPNVPFQRNYRTNIVGSFFTGDVTFTIIVDEEFNQPDYDMVAVSNAADLQSAVAKGGVVTLAADINLDELATKAAEAGLVLSKDVEIDGNGYTVSTSAVRAFHVLGAKNVTVKNLTLAATGERGFQIQEDGQTLVLENVKATSANRTVNITATSSNATVLISNCELHGLTPLNVWGENHTVVVENTTLYVEDNATEEGYAAVYNVADNTTVEFNGGEVVITGSAADDTMAGLISGSAKINFNGTKGELVVEGHVCAINYGKDRYSFATIAEALEVAKDGETIELIDNVTIESHLNITKSITLDFAGHTLTVDIKKGVGDDAIWVRSGNVVLTGNGTVQFINTAPETVYASAVFATGTANLTIENGTFVGAAEAVYAQSTAKVVINGGSFKSTEHPEFTLNRKDSAVSTCSILVNGGSFYQFNPAENAADGAKTNFVAAGKTVEQNGDWYVVR